MPEHATLHWRVRGVNSLGNGGWSQANQFVVGVTSAFDIDEQQLFNAVQPHLNAPLDFALFDITPTGILTTVRFTDGTIAIVTLSFTLNSGLMQMQLSNIAFQQGGSQVHMDVLNHDLMTVFMQALDDLLPDEYGLMSDVTLTNTHMNLSIITP